VVIKHGEEEKTTAYLVTGDTITITCGEESKVYNVVLYGDINGDEKVNALDLLYIKRHILKTDILTQARLEAADVNKDDKINALDLLIVKRYVLGDGHISQS
jgi:hypothetical protein